MSSSGTAKTRILPAISAVDWAEAYQELLPRVYHYFCLRTGDRLEAEDLTAATFELAWRDRSRYRKDLGAFSHWLFGIARHMVITHYRRSIDPPAPTEPTRREVSRPTEEAVTREEAFERLVALLGDLPSREQEIFSLKYGARLTNRAIAAAVGVTETNVGTILHRVLGRLRSQFKEGQ